ncbi:MAG: DUF3306 domain-containing protein [Gammaproteobacteria bacterium]|jgi:hypothetical protein
MKGETNKKGKQQMSLLQRWSRQKLMSVRETHENRHRSIAGDSQSSLSSTGVENIEEETPVPDIESLTEDSDLAGYFSDQVSDALRKAALRKIFRLDKFNICDGLDDYAEDYTAFESLGNIITADLKLREERERLKQLVGLNKVEENIQGIACNKSHDIDSENPLDGQVVAESEAHEEVALHPPAPIPMDSERPLKAENRDQVLISSSPTETPTKGHNRKTSHNDY